MADTNQRSVIVDHAPDWPELVSKTVDDLSRIGKREMELFESKLRLMIEAQTDKITGVVVLVVALGYGAFFLLSGVVLLLHLWFAWWLSFLIAGAAVISAGICSQMALRAGARQKEAE
jgi:hypothetical protein